MHPVLFHCAEHDLPVRVVKVLQSLVHTNQLLRVRWAGVLRILKLEAKWLRTANFRLTSARQEITLMTDLERMER